MESLAKLLSALALFAWPVIFVILLFKFSEQIKKLIESARGRKVTIKVAGNVTEITSSGTTLLSLLPLSNEN